MDGQIQERELRAVDGPLPRGGFVRAVTDNMSEGLLALGCDGEMMYINRAAERLLGWRQDELAGTLVDEVISHRWADGRAVTLEEHPVTLARREGEVVRVAEHLITRRDGSEIAVQITAAPFEILGGRGTVVVFSDVGPSAPEAGVGEQTDTASWPQRIRHALCEDRFVLYAQPIIDLISGETAKHELLIRMLGADGEVIAPGQFLPAAEASGLIVDIDRWVTREAVRLASRGHAVQLNLSAHSLAASDLIDDFRAELARSGADPSLLVVELTETALVDNEHAAELFIDHIAKLGCKLALDDFGSGYGGFRYLKRLPVDYLKIDTEFVRALPTEKSSQHIVKAVVSLARDFGNETVAEGVEEEETLQVLRELGVDYAQGYAIGRPLPAAGVLGQTRAPLG